MFFTTRGLSSVTAVIYGCQFLQGRGRVRGGLQKTISFFYRAHASSPQAARPRSACSGFSDVLPLKNRILPTINSSFSSRGHLFIAARNRNTDQGLDFFNVKRCVQHEIQYNGPRISYFPVNLTLTYCGVFFFFSFA